LFWIRRWLSSNRRTFRICGGGFRRWPWLCCWCGPVAVVYGSDAVTGSCSRVVLAGFGFAWLCVARAWLCCGCVVIESVVMTCEIVGCCAFLLFFFYAGLCDWESLFRPVCCAGCIYSGCIRIWVCWEEANSVHLD